MQRQREAGREGGSAKMSLLSDFFEALQARWQHCNLSTKSFVKGLCNRKHAAESIGSKKCNAGGEEVRGGEAETGVAVQGSVVAPSWPSSRVVSRTTCYDSTEVALHSKRSDCWIIIKNKVYDVSKFGEQHPGGTVIYTHAGRDATDVFAAFHSPSSWRFLQQFHIGDYKSDEPTPELLVDYRELRTLFARARLFKSSKLYYAHKTFTVFAFLAASITVINFNESFLAVLFSAFLLALFWQQSGWMSHDLLHHQVFDTRWLNTVLGFCWGNVMVGFSTGWWKNKHNLHHAAPNECDQTYKPIDSDIDTLPFLAWSKDILATVDSKVLRRVLRWQHIFFLPILFFARFTWLFYSFVHCDGPGFSLSTKLLEKSTILLHYTWLFGVAFSCLPPSMAVTWLLLSELLGGALLSTVFVISHNGMEVYNDSKDFVSAQVVSTRDIKTSMFNDWFTGGLNRQIEHHLFPTMPRHNLSKISPHVQALCVKHGLVYEDVSLALGTQRVFERLVEVAAASG